MLMLKSPLLAASVGTVILAWLGRSRAPGDTLRIGLLSLARAGLSHVAISVVSTGARSAERRDLLSTISGLSWREGLSARACGPRSRRRGVAICDSPALAGERNMSCVH